MKAFVILAQYGPRTFVVDSTQQEGEAIRFASKEYQRRMKAKEGKSGPKPRVWVAKVMAQFGGVG